MSNATEFWVQLLGDYRFHIKDVLYIKDDDESVVVAFHNGTQIAVTSFNGIQLDDLKKNYLKFHGWKESH